MIINFISLMFLLGLFGAIFVAPSMMCYGLVNLAEGYVTKLQMLLCCIPVFNYFYGWKKYSGNLWSLGGLSAIFLLFSSVSRFVVMFFFYSSTSAQTTTVVMFLLSIVTFYLLNAINIYMILKDSGAYSFGEQLFLSLTIIFGQISIGYYMHNKVKYYDKKHKTLV